MGVGSPAEGQTRARVKTLDRCVLTPPRYPNGVVRGRAPAPASPARCPSMCGSRCIATSQDGVSGACLARATRAALEAWAEAVEHSLPHCTALVAPPATSHINTRAPLALGRAGWRSYRPAEPHACCRTFVRSSVRISARPGRLRRATMAGRTESGSGLVTGAQGRWAGVVA